MGVIEDQIQRIYDRLDDIEKSLETRLRALEIWQAYQTGRLTALALFFSALGALVVSATGVLARHFKMLVLSVAALAVLLLSGCAGSVKPNAKYGIAETTSHMETATAYVDAASAAACAAKRGLEKIKAACAALSEAGGGAFKLSLQKIEDGRAEAQQQLEQVSLKLASAKEEQERTAISLRQTQAEIKSLEIYNVSLAKDRDAAVERADCVKKENARLAVRLSQMALAIAGCTAWLAWMVARSLGLKALPIPYCYAWPGLAAATAGAATFAYLRFFL